MVDEIETRGVEMTGEPFPQSMDSTVMKNKAIHPAYMMTIQHTVWGLIGIAVLIVIMMSAFVLREQPVPDGFLVVLGAIIGGLVTHLTNQNRTTT
jgi:hypothetical protein